MRGGATAPEHMGSVANHDRKCARSDPDILDLYSVECSDRVRRTQDRHEARR
jgi:hypothetical protein